MARSALRGTDAVDRAEDFEKLAIDGGRETHEPRQQAAHHRASFDIQDRVERDRLAQLRLDLTSRVLGDQDLDLERIDQERQRLVGNRLQDTANFREHRGDHPFQNSSITML